MAGRVRPRPFRILLPAVLVVPLLVATSPVRANHQPGGTYQGQVAGGTLTLDISADGTTLSATATDLQGNPSCDGSFSNVPIDAGHLFAQADANWRIQGMFPSVSNAAGALQMYAPCVVPTSGFDIPKIPKLCKCKDATAKARPRKLGFVNNDEVNKERVYNFVIENTIMCEGDVGTCTATGEIEIDGDRASVRKGESKYKCQKDDCPDEFKKNVEFGLKFKGDDDYRWIRAKGKKRIVRGRIRIKCDTKTITIPLKFVFVGGKFDKDDSDLGG
jgi:hypothetical protein